MPKRRRSPAGKESAAAKPAGRWTRPDIKHTSVYLPEAAYEALAARVLVSNARCLSASRTPHPLALRTFPHCR
jgi:hypothetical protein